MKKFKVSIHGENFVIDIDDDRERCGFYTTRYIEEVDASKAEGKALDLIRKELKGVVLNEISNPPMLYIEQIKEVESFGDISVPGEGFTWYRDKE